MRLFGYCLSILGAGCSHAAPDQPVKTDAATFRVVEVAGGLASPWSVAFLPDGDMLVTEKPGRLRLVQGGRLREDPIGGVPEVHYRGQGGLFDVVLDPDFARNATLYLSYAYAEGEATTTRVMRARYAPEGLSEQKVIFEAQPLVASSQHFGGRLAFMRDGTLLVTMGERFVRRELAQDLGTDLGKVLRIDRDGAAPPDNPFVGRQGARPEIYTYGHRNPQGLVVDPRDGTVWEEEHGAMGGDEINRLQPGANYGWPLVAYGVNYDGTPIGTGQHTAPASSRPPTTGTPRSRPPGCPSTSATSSPAGKGDLLVGALKYQLVSRLHLGDAGQIAGEEQFLKDALVAFAMSVRDRMDSSFGDRREPGRPLPARAGCRGTVSSLAYHRSATVGEPAPSPVGVPSCRRAKTEAAADARWGN